MKVVIYGFGQVGMRAAETLSKQKHEVTIIDREVDAFRRIEDEDGYKFVVGDAINQDVLCKAEVDKTDVFLALTGADNANLFAAQAARELFGVKRVVVRVADPFRAKAFSELGLTTICATDLIAEAVRKRMAAK